MSVAALEIKNVSKHYGTFAAVKDLTLRIEPGEIFGLLGPNGAGKSSTMHLISGLCRMEAGSISVFGRDVVTHATDTRRMVGLMHQEVVIDNFLPIGKMLELHAGYYGLSDDPVWREILIDRLALGPHLKKKMMGLSGGMKRRFMVAKALMHKPKLLILDEPTAGVDVELRKALWEFVREVNQRGTTVLLSTHYLEEAEELCDRIGIMNHGQLIALDRTRSLVRRMDSRIIHASYTGVLTETDIPDALRSLGAKIIDENLGLEVLLSAKVDLAEVLAALRLPNNSLSDVDVHRPDLEDVFISLTNSKVGAPS